MRTVGTKLTNEVGEFVKNTKLAAKATGELADRIGDARDESVSATAATDRLGKAVNYVSGEARTAARDVGKATGETKRFGVATEVAARHVDQLGDEIKNVKRELIVLAAAFATADTAAERLDISKAIRRTEADLKRLNKNKSLLSGLLPDPADVAKEGSKAGKSLAQGIRDGLTVSKGYLIAGVVGLGVAIAPQLGAIIAGAVVGGVGAGGLIGGLALAASSDEAIKGYAGRIGKSFVSNIQKEARDVFSGPIMANLGKVEALATRTGTALGKIFRNLAPSLGPFVDSLVRAGDAIMRSLVGASSAAGGPLKSLGNLIENVSNSTARFITLMAKDSKDGASGLDFLSSAITGVIDNAANFIHFLDMIHSGLDELATPFKAFRNWIEDNSRLLDLTKDGYDKGTVAADLYRKGIIGVNGSATDYTHYLAAAVDSTNKLSASQSNEMKAAHGQRDALKAVSDELRAQSDPAFALLSAQDNLRQKQDELTAATRKYGSRSKEADTAARGLATAAIDLQGAAGSLSAKFSGKLTPAMEATLRAAGLTSGQIAAVRRQFILAKGAGDAYAKTYRAKVITDYINRISNQSINTIMNSYNKEKAAIKKKAAGGPITGPGPKGRDSELMMAAPGEHVWTAREVDAAGGHGAVMRLRASALSTPQRYADGGPVPSQSTRVMPATASSVTTVVYEHRVTFADTGGEIGQLLVKAIRTSPGVRAEMSRRLGVRTA